MVFCLIKTENEIIIYPFKIEFLVINLPQSCPTPAAINNKQFNKIGSDKLDQCSHDSVMDAIGDRFEGIVPSHGGTQK